jgi:hypothetical protein
LVFDFMLGCVRLTHMVQRRCLVLFTGRAFSAADDIAFNRFCCFAFANVVAFACTLASRYIDFRHTTGETLLRLLKCRRFARTGP